MEKTSQLSSGTKPGKETTILIEVGPHTRKQILQTKLKIGWEICKVEDYIVPNRCYRCSRNNHKHSDCERQETCPHCAGKHKLKECTAPASEHNFMNCISYNRYHKNEKIEGNHSALRKDCPSLQAVLTKYRKNIDY